MTGYTKLFGSILASSLWQESKETKILWITMLAAANKWGVVEASIPGLAHMATLTLPETEAALATLEAPDPYSRTTAHEGRRIAKVAGGWQLLNHGLYREKMNADERKEYNRIKQAEHREKVKKSQTPSNPVNDNQSQSALSAHSDTRVQSTSAEAEVPQEQLVLTGTTVPPLPPKGGEGRGITEGRESKNLPTTEQSKRFAKIFHRRLTTPWQPNEVRAYRKLGTIPEDDLSIVEKYYADNWPPNRDTNILRHDLITFLRNFQGEVGRAYAAQEPKRDTRRAREIETVHTADTLPRL